jgi:hypothetical protein
MMLTPSFVAENVPVLTIKCLVPATVAATAKEVPLVVFRTVGMMNGPRMSIVSFSAMAVPGLVRERVTGAPVPFTKRATASAVEFTPACSE